MNALLAGGDEAGARVALLADSDDWWDAEPPPPEQLARVARAGSLREAMDLLGMGRVADYFAYRWSDPTYLASLALLQQHWPGGRPVVEVACGAGHLLRELAGRGCTDLLGVDVVWAKLWLARRFVCPQARYVCADVTALPALDVAPPAYVMCHDAAYFFPDKPAAFAALRSLARSGGTLVVGHAHVQDPHGVPETPQRWAELAGEGAVLYDDDALTRALLADRPPDSAGPDQLAASEAIGLVAGAPGARAPYDLGCPTGETRPNPLYVDGALAWPNERYASEYGPRSGYLAPHLEPLPPDAARRRMLLDLPDHW